MFKYSQKVHVHVHVYTYVHICMYRTRIHMYVHISAEQYTSGCSFFGGSFHNHYSRECKNWIIGISQILSTDTRVRSNHKLAR